METQSVGKFQDHEGAGRKTKQDDLNFFGESMSSRPCGVVGSKMSEKMSEARRERGDKSESSDAS